MFVCPRCRKPMARVQGRYGLYWQCAACQGRTTSLSLLRRRLPKGLFRELWQAARTPSARKTHACPGCGHAMVEAAVHGTRKVEHLDLCRRCQFVWFDPGEEVALPVVREPVAPPKLHSKETRERLALLEVERVRQLGELQSAIDGIPTHQWHLIPAVFGLPVEHDAPALKAAPWATWGLAGLIAVVSLVSFLYLEHVIRAWGLIPAEFDRHFGLTFVTSFFLHAGLAHLAGNLYFLCVFGDNVEDWLGRWRFLALLALSTLAGDAAHIVWDPLSTVPCIGASGGVSGIIACYALQFPRVHLGLLVGVYRSWAWWNLPAWVLFLVWIALQIAGANSQLRGGGVAFTAHLGGVVMGAAVWCVVRAWEWSRRGAAVDDHAAP